MKRTVGSFVAICALAPTWVVAQGRLGVDFTPKLVPIVEGIYVWEGPLALPGEEEIVRTNSLVVVTGEGVVVIDGQDNVEEAERMIEAIAEVTSEPVRYLVNASSHGDHVNGNEAFGDAVVIAHEEARKSMAEEGAARLPDVVYSDRMTLHLGEKTLELHFFGPAHTAGDTITYVREDGVAFLSEVYFNGLFTSLGDGFAESHVEVLAAIRKLGAEWILPGHGYVDGQSKDELRAGFDKYTENVTLVLDRVRHHVASGHSLEETLAAVDAELGEFAEMPLYEFLKGRTIEGTYRALTDGGRR